MLEARVDEYVYVLCVVCERGKERQRESARVPGACARVHENKFNQKP